MPNRSPQGLKPKLSATRGGTAEAEPLRNILLRDACAFKGSKLTTND